MGRKPDFFGILQRLPRALRVVIIHGTVDVQRLNQCQNFFEPVEYQRIPALRLIRIAQLGPADTLILCLSDVTGGRCRDGFGSRGR
jgi:hypothetical protein